MSKEADVAAMIAMADEWGGADVVFNNAGIMHNDVCLIFRPNLPRLN